MAPKVPNERLRMIIMIVLAVIMVLIATICVVYRTWVVKPVLPPVGESSPPAVSSDPPVNGSEEPALPEYDPVQPKVSGERKSQDHYTILVFGTDESSNLTDTMMVVSYDVTNQKATVMSIPRDTLINVKRPYKKLNGVYSWYGGGQDGITALKNEVSELVGFMPDYYVQVNWELVGQMVNAIGGVYFDIPRDMWYVDPYQDLYIDLRAGYQLMDGNMAMQLVRWRKNMDPKTYQVIEGISDIERLHIQQNFLKAVLQQALQLKNVTKISQLAELFGENVVSDLSIENLFWFGSQAVMGGLNVDDVQFCTMPWIAGNDYKGTSYVFPIWSKLLKLTNDQLNPYVENVTMKQLDLMEILGDGTLSSSTGVLADPDMGVLPPEVSEEPDPNASDDPNVSDDPGATEEPRPSDLPGYYDEPVVSDDPDVSEDPDAGWNDDPYASEDPDAGWDDDADWDDESGDYQDWSDEEDDWDNEPWEDDGAVWLPV